MSSRGAMVVSLKKPKEPADPDSMDHNGSFAKYMQFKNQKLREQFSREAAETDPELGGPAQKLFAGISIHVNGFTNPTHQVRFACFGQCCGILCSIVALHMGHILQELRQIMATHGGRFEVYYYKDRVTHIICSNLPNAKIKALEKERYVATTFATCTLC